MYNIATLKPYNRYICKTLNQQPLTRPMELLQKFLADVDQHLHDIVTGRATELFEIKEFANRVFIHPTHFSNTIKQATGKSPCHFYQEKIMETACTLLAKRNMPIRDIAFLLTYDPSNFTKIFKRFVGQTPKQYRLQLADDPHKVNT